MDLSGVLETLPVVFTGGAGVGAGVYFLKWLFEWIGARVDRKEAAVEAGNAQLNEATQALIRLMQDQITGQEVRIGQLLTRLDTVEEDLAECREKHADGQEEISRLRGLLQGFGEARQHAQLIVSQERIGDRLTDKIVEHTKKDGQE